MLEMYATINHFTRNNWMLKVLNAIFKNFEKYTTVDFEIGVIWHLFSQNTFSCVTLNTFQALM